MAELIWTGEPMKKRQFLKTAALASTVLATGISPALAQERTEFRVAWSIYVGWMPWGYLEDSGIMDKWAEKYGIDVEIVQINDYVESINQYTAGAFDGVSATNMDTLSIPSGGGVDTTALIVGDYLQRQRRGDPEGRGRSDVAGRANRSIWWSCRSRTTCWRARSTASGLSRGRPRRASSTPPTPT